MIMTDVMESESKESGDPITCCLEKIANAAGKFIYRLPISRARGTHKEYEEILVSKYADLHEETVLRIKGAYSNGRARLTANGICGGWFYKLPDNNLDEFARIVIEKENADD